MVAYSCTYCGSASSRLKPAFFVKKGCITSGVASPNCRICNRSICRRRGWYTRLEGGPAEGAGAMGLGGGCVLEEAVVATSKGRVAAWNGIASSIGGPSVSVPLGIADIESVVLWCLSIEALEPVKARGSGTCRSICDIAGGDVVSRVEDSVIVRLRPGVDAPEGVTVGITAAWRRSTDP
jgi:hypothetical protein